MDQQRGAVPHPKVNEAFNEARRHLSYLSDHVALYNREKDIIRNQLLVLDWMHHDVTERQLKP
jgi:hypothetical protein